MEKVLQLDGLDCAGCAAELEEKISKIDGVTSATLIFVNQKLMVSYISEDILPKIIDTINHFEEVRVVDENEKKESITKTKRKWEHKKEWCMLLFSALFFAFGVCIEHILKDKPRIILGYIFYAIAYLAVGYSVLFSTVKNIYKGKFFDENFLMTVASIGAICIGEWIEGVAVMWLYQLGELLQAIAVGASRHSVTQLLELKSETANLLCFDGTQKQVSPEELKVGNIIVVKAGEKVPVDGKLLSQSALLDTKSLTGESNFREVKRGEEMLSGCINAGGMYEMMVTRKYKDSAVSTILEIVETAASGKANPEKFITKFARVYTPIVCVLALLVAICVPFIDGLLTDGTFYYKDFSRWIHSALTFLVISCPCALIISVPLTYFSGIGVCAKNGVLVKGAIYLDIVAQGKTIAFDKTGTLTEGEFKVRGIYPTDDITEEELLSYIATIERGSSHPISRAFKDYKTMHKAKNVTEMAGYGLRAEIGEEIYLLGNEKLMLNNNVLYKKCDSIYTVIYLAKNEQYLGAIELGDKLRDETKSTIESLKGLGILRCIMLTGDKIEIAQVIANEVGMSEVNADLLPTQKAEKAAILKQEGCLIYVGDGINDAPVMATADCAVSMGKLGSAAAVEVSDMVLIADNLSALPKAIKIARKTKRIVLQNIIFSIAMKVLFMVVGFIGILPLSLAVFADVGVMLLAVCNSFRVRRIKN